MTPDIVRTFFGFDLPRAVSDRAAGLRTLVDDPKKAVRWVKGRNLHLTLRFLGATPRSAVDDIAKAMEAQLQTFPSLEIVVRGTGVFPAPARPRALWMAIEGATDQLVELEQAIHQVVEPLGFPREERDYLPHITLGRVRYPQKITPDVTMFLNAQYEPVECSLKALHLYESRMGDRGVNYIPLARFTLQSVPSKGTDQEKP